MRFRTFVASLVLLRLLPSLFLDKVHAALRAFARFVLHDFGVHTACVLNRFVAARTLALTGFLFFAATDANRDARECHGH